MHPAPSYDELMNQKPNFIAKCDGYLYVKLPPRQFYDNVIWKVNEKTKEVTYMAFTDYIVNIYGRQTYVVKPDWEK